MGIPTEVNPGEAAILEKLWRGEGPSFRRIFNSLPRPHPDPQLEWHLQLYDVYTRLKRSLEKRKRTPLLSDQDLKDLRIVRGADLDIDQSRPLDVEPRFFAHAPSRIGARYLRAYEKTKEYGWPDLKILQSDLDQYGKLYPSITRVNRLCHAAWATVERTVNIRARLRESMHPFLTQET